MSQRWAAVSDMAFPGLLVAVLVLSAGGHLVVGDEETMFRVTQNLLTGRGVAVGRLSPVVSDAQGARLAASMLNPLPSCSASAGLSSFRFSACTQCWQGQPAGVGGPSPRWASARAWALA
jgi:hypothetical protein